MVLYRQLSNNVGKMYMYTSESNIRLSKGMYFTASRIEIAREKNLVLSPEVSITVMNVTCETLSPFFAHGQCRSRYDCRLRWWVLRSRLKKWDIRTALEPVQDAWCGLHTVAGCRPVGARQSVSNSSPRCNRYCQTYAEGQRSSADTSSLTWKNWDGRCSVRGHDPSARNPSYSSKRSDFHPKRRCKMPSRHVQVHRGRQLFGRVTLNLYLQKCRNRAGRNISEKLEAC